MGFLSLLFDRRILIFPSGNNVDDLSMYLDSADSDTLPYGWTRYAQISLSVVDQIQNIYSIRRETQHQFNARDSDWGFTSFMPLASYTIKKGVILLMAYASFKLRFLWGNLLIICLITQKEKLLLLDSRIKERHVI
ncbi:hypothetical protein P3L10_006754 [Capsicum annuum]